MIKEKKGSKISRKIAILFIAPCLIGITIFSWYPFFLGFLIAFQKYSIFTTKWVGLQNFKNLFNDPMFPIVIRNTFYYAFLSIAIPFLIPIIVAILLLEMKRSVIRIMMILWFLPAGGMGSLLLLKWYYNPNYGLFNQILNWLGLPGLQWLNDPRLAMICLVLPGLIMYGPGLIWIATLQSIPDELYEAAEIEGAGLWTKIWHITLPRLRPIIAVLLLLSVIGSMQMFSQAFLMTGGGPNNATRTIVMYMYNCGFEMLKFGYGTAVAIVLFIILTIMVIIQRKLFKENIDV